jgi:cytochrome c553
MGDQALSDDFDKVRQVGSAARQLAPLSKLGLVLVLVGGAMAPLTEALADDAKTIVAGQCVACHGLDGNAPIPTFPRLAGIQEEYLAKQLTEMASGVRASEVMMPIVAAYSKSELQSLAAYFAKQRRQPGAVKDPTLAEAGRVIYHEGNKATGVPACAGCHRPDGGGTPRSPLIAGQDAGYTYQQLLNFHQGARNNDRGKLMRTVTGRMTDQEMRAVAEYVAGMSVTVAQR